MSQTLVSKIAQMSKAHSTMKSLPDTPALGMPVPNDAHAVSVQLPKWKDMVGLGCHDPRISDVQRGGYPRSFLHQSVVQLSDTCLEECKESSKACLIFPSHRYAQACIDFSTSRDDSATSYDPQECYVASFGLYTSVSATKPDIHLFAALLPESLRHHALVFWRLTGLGVSSRLAEMCLTLHMKRLSMPHEHTEARSPARNRHYHSIAHNKVRTRLANLHNRTVSQPIPSTPLTRDDIFLFQTGMAAIYHTHQLLLQVRSSKTVVFGFPYELTLKLMQSYGPAWEFWGFGTDDELDQFEALLRLNGTANQVQAVWCECASNPLLRTVDLARIRRLADQYNFVVVIDDTIGSVANVDVLDVADIVVTSLTKSFSGYANVMAGSITLNSRSPLHQMLRAKLTENHESLLFDEDAKQLDINSRDYLQRSTQANRTASALVRIMGKWSSKPGSPFTSIYYPEVCWSKQNYCQRMRPATVEYTPGFGSLFTIELADVDTAEVFFDALPIHKGPSLGAQYTLAQPYVQTVFQNEKEWAARYGLKESIVRISVGLEDGESLVSAFSKAAQITDDVYRQRVL